MRRVVLVVSHSASYAISIIAQSLSEDPFSTWETRVREPMTSSGLAHLFIRRIPMIDDGVLYSSSGILGSTTLNFSAGDP